MAQQILYKHLVPLLFSGIVAAIALILYFPGRARLIENVDRILVGETSNLLESLRNRLAELPSTRKEDTLAILRSIQVAFSDPIKIQLVSRFGKLIVSTDHEKSDPSGQKPRQFAHHFPAQGLSSVNPFAVLDPAKDLITGYIYIPKSQAPNLAAGLKGAMIYLERDIKHRRQESLAEIEQFMWLQFISIALLAIAGGVFFQFMLNRRVSGLLAFLNQVRSGNWSIRTGLDGNDEISRIGQCIDRLLNRLVSEQTSLAFSEAKIKAMLETATDGIINMNAKGCVETMNSAAERIFGYPKDQVIGRDVSMLMPEPFAKQHGDYVTRYLRTGEKRIIGIGREISGLRSDGSEFPMELSVSEVEFAGEPCFTGIVRDISARKRTEEQLRQSQEQLHLTFENAPIGIVTCDLNCRIINANRASTQIVGYAREQLIGMAFTDLVHPAERENCLDFAKKAKHNQQGSTTLAQRWLHKNGNLVSGILHLGMIHNEEGIQDRFVLQMEDNTEQLNAENEARQLRDRIAHVARITTLGEMVAGIAHEINQPLAAIVNYTEASQRLLRNESANPDDLLHAMKQASAQAHRAAKVLQRLRDFAKMRSIRRETVNPNSLVRDVVALAKLENPAPRSAITLELEKHLPPIEADAIQIQQVILNLIRNGIDAMQEAGTLEQNLIIRTVNEPDEFIRIEVIDWGPGVDEADADQIFDPFFSTKGSGMGLGLSICRSIARSHGGQLDFKNNPDQGATFYLRLPTGST